MRPSADCVTGRLELVHRSAVMNRLFRLAAFLTWTSSRIWAADIPIVNAGFEQVVLPCAGGPGCATAVGVPMVGWTGTGNFWTFKPSTGAGAIFPGGVPEGVNVAALAGNGTITQTLTATLRTNTNYTLQFSIGSRADQAFAGYRVELLAGSTVLASDSSLSPPTGTFVTGSESPAAASLPLRHRGLGRRRAGECCAHALPDPAGLQLPCADQIDHLITHAA
jgi:hypothetical protein